VTDFAVTWTDTATCTRTTTVVGLPDTTPGPDVPAALEAVLAAQADPGVRVRVDYYEAPRVPPQDTLPRRRFMTVNGW
jgi:hypothetical protein